MRELTELQRDFQQFVLQGARAIENEVLGSARTPIAKRLAVYAEAYRGRLREALEGNYPMLAKLMGAEEFSRLAAVYIERHRSVHFSIRWYGDRLATELAQQPIYQQQPLLTELARWEWAMTLAFDAADAPLLTRAALAAVTPEAWSELRLKLHPSTQMLMLRTNAPGVWQSLNQDDAPFVAVGEAQDQGEGPSHQDWIIWRRGLDTFFRSLKRAEAQSMQAIVAGENFATICEVVAQHVEEDAAAAEAARFLAQWIDEGLLVAN